MKVKLIGESDPLALLNGKEYEVIWILRKLQNCSEGQISRP